MSKKVLFILPPFTQLNTPYPSTACIKGFFNSKSIPSNQVDLGIEVILALFSAQGFELIFNEIAQKQPRLSKNCQRIVKQRDKYIRTIDAVISFLQGKNPTMAYLICQDNFLPKASRSIKSEELEWAFGTTGTSDKAKHLATLYLEDISDLIVDAIDPHFGFSRYAEQLGRSASSFDELHNSLRQPDSLIDTLMIRLLEEKIAHYQPTLIGLSVPFPGNLYCALKCGKWIKKHYPQIKTVIGGGFPNTELRSLSETLVFECVDFITLDDGEAPMLCLIHFLDGKRTIHELKRTFAMEDGRVTYFDGSKEDDIPQSDIGTPDFSDLPLDKYISVIEIKNPMHRLWNDGRWNKLMLAHGCYWAKCTFCDTTLDYIKRYQPNTAKVLCDRIETIIRQTGQNGFHFTDEAAPPGLLKELALEILKRNLVVAWWTNIRFEKSYTRDLCDLLRQSGCIAVSGGLEVASDRLLKLINKGVTVSQVAKVASNFTESGIMVHAYLMYGFPTQTAQETIDSLEIVRQLFLHGLIQSGFWHHFALTAHSPIGLEPEKYHIKRDHPEAGTFANNDLTFTDPKGCNHEAFSAGLRTSLFNYMQGTGFELPLSKWFDFKVPRTTISPNYIEKIVLEKAAYR